MLLGASNLSRGLAPALTAALAAADDLSSSPPSVLIAAGNGRAYSCRSSFLLRDLPAIDSCGLWPALARLGNDRPIYALITDLGNDLAYGVHDERVLRAVRGVAARLAGPGHRLTIVSPPVRSLERFPIGALDLIRRVLYPSSRIPAARLLTRIRRLDAGLRSLCGPEASGLRFVEQPAAWFGLDPIHHRRRRQGEAWRTFVAAWGASPERIAAAERARARRLGWRLLLDARPQTMRLAGREIRSAQPRLRLEGARVSFY